MKYRFNLIAKNGTRETQKAVFPCYKNDLSIDWATENNGQYFRAKLSGKLHFVAADFDFINTQGFETEFVLILSMSRDGIIYNPYWKGHFFKTDCEFDVDNKQITVSPKPVDQYTQLLSGLENEYNLIDLAPAISHIRIDKRPLIQLYALGEKAVGCLLSGMYWEQDTTEAITNETELRNTYHFAMLSGLRKITITGDIIPEDVKGVYYGEWNEPNTSYTYRKGDYEFRYFHGTTLPNDHRYSIVRISDGRLLFYKTTTQSDPLSLDLDAQVAASGTAHAEFTTKKVFGRYIFDVPSIPGVDVFRIPADDIVANNRNYTYCAGYAVANTILYSDTLTETPTKYGIFQPGLYYQKPFVIDNPELFPVARSTWDEFSVWFAFNRMDWVQEQNARQEYTLRDAFPLWSCIKVLLAKIAPDISFEPTTEYSQFLFGSADPIAGSPVTLFITPKSNILAGNYDQPAQKAPTTLKQIFDMLEKCFRVYWFIDADNKLHIEHILYFLNGGSYTEEPTIGIDMTQLSVTRSGKPWAFNTSLYSYDKIEMPERYEFGWMDDCTYFFEGFPINIRSRYIEEGKVENINVYGFTSDVDFMLLNPEECDPDGFALLGATMQSGSYKLPYLQFQDKETSTAHYLQNAYMAFYWLQQYYLWDMPSLLIDADIANTEGDAFGLKKLKTQTVELPMENDPELYKLVRTEIGDGKIDKISINLSSRKAKITLAYDTK